MLLVVKVGGQMYLYIIDRSKKSGWARAYPAHQAPTSLETIKFFHTAVLIFPSYFWWTDFLDYVHHLNDLFQILYFIHLFELPLDVTCHRLPIFASMITYCFCKFFRFNPVNKKNWNGFLPLNSHAQI